MTRTAFKARWRELWTGNKLEVEIGKEARRLFDSGAVDTHKYGDDFALPKIILGVAANNVAARFRPYLEEHKADKKNLEKF